MFFFRGSGSTPGSPSPMLWSGLSSGPVAQLLPERLSGARGQHLLAKPVRGSCGSALGSGNRTLETRLLAMRSGFCHVGTELRTRASAFRGLAQGPMPLVLRSQHGLCAPASDSAPPVMVTIIPATRVWSQPSRSHTEERTLSHRRSSLCPGWPLGFAHSRFPDLEELGKRLRIEAGLEHLPKSSGLTLKCPAASPPKTLLQEAHLSTVIFCSTARPLQQ